MKSNFLRYRERCLNEVFDTFKPFDKELINNFLVFCGGTAGKTTINKYRAVLIKICDVFGGDLKSIDLVRLRNFLNILNQSDLLPATKNKIRKVLKRFLRENYDDWSSRFKELRDIKCESDINQDKINANTILRLDEVESLVRGSEFLRDKAMIMLFFETAARPEEVLKLRWKDINLDKGDVKLKSSKTGNLRINPIQNSIVHLQRYKNEFPFLNLVSDDFVFPSPVDRNKYISESTVSIHVKRLGKRVLKRDIFLYLIRHTRATQLQKVLPAKIYEKFMDHSIDTASRYSHLDKDDIRDSMFEHVYKVEELPLEKKIELENRIKYLESKIDEVLDKFNQVLSSVHA